MNGSIGHSRTSKKGIAQGTILSPLLFTFYINDSMAVFEDDTFESAYADDLLITHSDRNVDMIVASLQPGVDKVVVWSGMARLTLNSSKFKTAFFSLNCAEAAC